VKNNNRILFLALLVLVALIILPKVMPEKKAYPSQLAAIDTSMVQRIELSQPDGTISLVKSMMGWELELDNWPADKMRVGRLMQELAALDLHSLVNENTDYAQDERYELDDAKATKLSVYEGDALVLKARLGKPARDWMSCVARLDEAAPIYRMAKNLKSSLSTQRKNWLDKSLFRMEQASIQNLHLQAGTSLELQNQDSLWVAHRRSASGVSSRFELGGRPLEELEQKLAHLAMNDLASPEQAMQLQTASPVLVAQLKFSDGRDLQLSWFRLNGMEEVFCQLAEGAPYLLFGKSVLESFETVLAELKP
jgi:hypothetical protein